MAKVATVPALRVGDARDAVARFGRSPRTTAIPVLPPDTNEATWLEARRSLVTASEVAAVLGRSPYNSPFSLWWRKQPDWPEPEDMLNLHIGRKLEAVIGELWQERHPEAGLYRPGAALWTHHEHRWLGATPDYLAVVPTMTHSCPREDGEPHEPGCETKQAGVHIEPVECKSDEGGEGWGRAGTDEIPFHHLCQVVTQAVVLGAPRGHLIRMSGKRVTEYTVEVARQETLIRDILDAGKSFVVSLESGVTPELDGHDATTEALKALHPNVIKGTEASIPEEMAEEFRLAHATKTAWEARLKDVSNRIRERMGVAQAQYGVVESTGERLVTRSHYKRQGYTVGPCEVDMIRKAY